MCRWDTAVAMFLCQIEKDEGPEEREEAQRILARAETLHTRKQALRSLLSSLTMCSTSEVPEPSTPPPCHGHVILVLNIFGDGELQFRPSGDGGGVVAFPLGAGDVYCFTGDYR